MPKATGRWEAIAHSPSTQADVPTSAPNLFTVQLQPDDYHVEPQFVRHIPGLEQISG
jgi:hypothetical protein